jgi:hypothetical protein
MPTSIDVRTHRDFTVDEIIEETGWSVPSKIYRDNMRVALDYFQRTVPKAVLRKVTQTGRWNLQINGLTIELLKWMQAIDFRWPVKPSRLVTRGAPLISFRCERPWPGKHIGGNWYTGPSTDQEKVAIHSTQTRLHKFKARMPFTCMESTAADAYVDWVPDNPPQLRHGGSQQLFIWNAALLLEPLI